MIEPQLRVFEDADELIRAATEQIASLAIESVTQHGRFCVALAGGETPQTMYRLLAQPPHRTRLSWSQTLFFWGDERCVPPDHPESNYRQAQLALLDQINVPPENVHRIRGELEPIAAAQDYAEQLQQASLPDDGLEWPRFDLVLLGLGVDGHTASLFPGSIAPGETQSPVIAVTAHYQDRPAYRVTLTPLVFNAARNVFFLVTGVSKAEALGGTLQGKRDPERWPAQRIQPTKGNVTWLVDQAAASQLKG
jgi:6-phosphogluconolactonase